MRHPARLGAAVAIAAAALLGSAAPAWAHAEVQSTYPAAGSMVHGTLTRVAIRFDEAVTLVPDALRVTTDQGIPVNLESPRLSRGGKVLSARVQDRLATGGYVVGWRVQADDGHLESSSFSFSVGAASAAHGAAAPMTTEPPPAPGEPLWPVLVAAGIAIAGGLGAGTAVSRGLRLVRSVPVASNSDRTSLRDHESLRLPM